MKSKVEILPSTLIYHELIGLEILVIRSTNPALTGIRGRVIDETKKYVNRRKLEVAGTEDSKGGFGISLPDPCQALRKRPQIRYIR